MTKIREINVVGASRPTLEGAGVQLRRVFGHGHEAYFDPFLMMDDFRCGAPEEFQAGFPWHPHRGIETITYVIEGEVDHADSLGNSGTIGAGDVQWMTAGSGIIHQEMPRGTAAGRMGGFQLWANLPASHKMMDPRYVGVERDSIPVAQENGARIAVIAGTVGEVTGPVTDIVIEPEYLDVRLDAGSNWTHPATEGHTVFAYLFEGSASFGRSEIIAAEQGHVVLLDDGDMVAVRAGESGARLLLISGKPLGEPIAWGGPIVMNTREDLDEAFRELDAGTFVKHGAA